MSERGPDEHLALSCVAEDMPRYLVVAHQTVRSRELAEAVSSVRAREPDASFVLLVPATPLTELLDAEHQDALAAATANATSGRQLLERLGAAVEQSIVGGGSPIDAIASELTAHPGHYDAIIFCTLPEDVSHWLRLDAVDRVKCTSGLPVLHVIGRPESLGR